MFLDKYFCRKKQREKDNWENKVCIEMKSFYDHQKSMFIRLHTRFSFAVERDHVCLGKEELNYCKFIEQEYQNLERSCDGYALINF